MGESHIPYHTEYSADCRKRSDLSEAFYHTEIQKLKIINQNCGIAALRQ
jgi:predicted secreted protein